MTNKECVVFIICSLTMLLLLTIGHCGISLTLKRMEAVSDVLEKRVKHVNKPKYVIVNGKQFEIIERY